MRPIRIWVTGRWMIVVVGLAFALLPIGCMGEPSKTDSSSVSIRLQLPGPGATGIGHLYVYLINKSNQSVKVWRRNNSWGYDSISFAVRRRGDGQKVLFLIKTLPCEFTKNGPGFHEIKSGTSVAEKINLGDGFWGISSEQFDNLGEELEVRAEYASGPSPEADKYGVFVGSRVSEWVISKPPHAWLKAAKAEGVK